MRGRAKNKHTKNERGETKQGRRRGNHIKREGQRSDTKEIKEKLKKKRSEVKGEDQRKEGRSEMKGRESRVEGSRPE